MKRLRSEYDSDGLMVSILISWTNQAYCFDGSCRSHSDQCRLLWGPTGRGSAAQCYAQNTYGNKTGNCGYDLLTKTFTKCSEEYVTQTLRIVALICCVLLFQSGHSLLGSFFAISISFVCLVLFY